MFRFTIRDVLWLTLVAAVATCWYIDHRGLGVLSGRVTVIELKLRTAEAAAQSSEARLGMESQKVASLAAKNRKLEYNLRQAKR